MIGFYYCMLYNTGMEEIILNTVSWTEKEYDHKERHIDWYWTLGLISLIGMGLTIWKGNYLFALFILVSTACIILFYSRHPMDIEFIIQTSGFTIGKEFYKWQDIKSFNIDKSGKYPKLILEINKYFLPISTIPANNEVIEDIRTELTKIIPQKDIKESPTMVFIEKFGL